MLTAGARKQGLTPGDGVRDGCLKDNKVPFSEEGQQCQAQKTGLSITVTSTQQLQVWLLRWVVSDAIGACQCDGVG